MKKLNFKRMAQVSGGKAFGADRSCTACSGGTQVCHRDFYVFWLKIHQSTMTEAC